MQQLRYHAIQAGAERQTASREVAVRAEAGEVELVGPRYSGRVELPAVCELPIVLFANPKPATVEFRGAPPRAAVSCIDCPGIDPHANFVVSSLPPMVVQAWTIEVTFWVRAEGYEALREVFRLHPGRNEVSLRMIPRRPRSATGRPPRG